MIRALLAALACATLAGCASLYWAGASEYEISPIVGKDGALIGCCTLTVHSGKQYATVNAVFTKTGNDYAVSLNETQIEAFKGQAIAAGAASDVAAATAAAVVAALKTVK
jgi:hypothetical protein